MHERPDKIAILNPKAQQMIYPGFKKKFSWKGKVALVIEERRL